MFDPVLKIGQILKYANVVDTFKCGNMGGVRRSKTKIKLFALDVHNISRYNFLT